MSQSYSIDYLELPSTDGEASQQFFTAAFGWSFQSYGATYRGIVGAALDSGIDSSDSRVAAPLPVIRTTDLVEAERAVRAAGGVITTPAYDFPGGRRFHFREPGGSELAVWISNE